MEGVTRECLRLAFRPDPSDGGFARLRVAASALGFSGSSSFWAYPATLTDFAAAMRVYPLDASRPAVLVGGHGGSVNGTYPPLETVRVEVGPEGPFGQVGLTVSIREDDGLTGRSRHSVEMVLLTPYERLGRFANDLDRVAIGAVEEALIDGERLAGGSSST